MRNRSPVRLVSLRRLPVLLGAGLLAFCWAYLGWNATVGSLVPGLHLRLTMPLGFKDQAPPVLSWRNILDGAYQRLAAERIGLFSPIYAKSVRWKNQAYFSLLGMSATPSVIVGPGQQLVEIVYVREYCTRNAAQFAAGADREAERIRALQDVVEARGQVFAYLLTPSKPAVYPSILPRDYSCPAPLADREAKLPLWRAALRRAGVHVADAAAAVYAARDKYPMGMFPKGGIHWNRLAAALGAQALIETVNAQRKLLTPFTFDVGTSMSPSASDRDLHDILNLMQRSVRYPVPVLTYHRAGPPGPCATPAPRIVEVSGSFAFELDEALSHAPCAPEISLWWYWNNTHFLFPPGTTQKLPVDAAERTQDLRRAQIVVLEENESLLPGSEHGRRLIEALLPRTAAGVR